MNGNGFNFGGLNLLGAAGDGTFNWYGLMIALGMLTAVVIAYNVAKRHGYNPDSVFDIVLVCIPMAIVGARTYYVIFDEAQNPGKWTFLEYLQIWDGGLAIYGGLIFAVLGGVIVRFLVWRKRKSPNKMNFAQMLDLGFTVIILAQGIGRWGNFFNQEAYGNLITDSALKWFPYGVYIDKQGAWYQATFFYEFLLDVGGFLLLLWLYNGKRRSFDGFVFSVYCLWYGMGRFLIEGLRDDSLYIGNMRVSQIVSILIMVFGAGWIIYHCIMARRGNKKIFIMQLLDGVDKSYYGYDTTIYAFSKANPEAAEEVRNIKFFSFKRGENAPTVRKKKKDADDEETTVTTRTIILPDDDYEYVEILVDEESEIVKKKDGDADDEGGKGKGGLLRTDRKKDYKKRK